MTRFTDTGWTAKFAALKGIVTEYGGVLCHTAIVSREYGIPCVVCTKDATKLIKDGSKITIEGSTGGDYKGRGIIMFIGKYNKSVILTYIGIAAVVLGI